MPKKTKKEKLLARYHRKLRSLENLQVTGSPTLISTQATQVTPAEVKNVSVKPITEESRQTNQYFFSDLKKSLLLIVLIIGVEVGLYFAKLIKSF
ncbi:conserved hypothetical protein [Candidatus Roizmanbacteria bacterium]|nr:conserved hypothetical protein [Candidatus Roizmanbacteria bacterium]